MRAVVSLVAATVAAGLDVTSTAAPTGLTVDDVATVLAYDASEGGALRAGLEALATSGPPEVRAAVERMLTSSPVDADWRLTCLERVLAAAGDVRDRAVFEHLVLGPGPWVDRGVVAAAIGVGQERLRQLRLRASERVDAAAGYSPLELRELATAVAGEVGSAAPRAAVDEALASLGLPGLCDPRSRMLVRMAGPTDTSTAIPIGSPSTPPSWSPRPGGCSARTAVCGSPSTSPRSCARWAWPTNTSPPGWAINRSGSPTASSSRRRARRVTSPSGPCTHGDGRCRPTSWRTGCRADTPGLEALWSGADRRFVVDDDDALALAEWADAPTGGLELHGRPAGTLHVTVDDAVLAGASGPVPRAVARGTGAASRVATDVPHPVRADSRGR